MTSERNFIDVVTDARGKIFQVVRSNRSAGEVHRLCCGLSEQATCNSARNTASGPAILIGAPWVEDHKLYNAFLLLDGGKVAGHTFKVDLPNYGVFDEKRVFVAGPSPRPLTVRGVQLGVPVCEDVWTQGVCAALADAGAEILCVSNGSPFEAGKEDLRLKLAASRVNETGLPLIYLNQPGANTRVRTWCPTPGPQYGFLVTHNEAISIADYLTVRDAAGKPAYRPTCNYAYHPADDAVLSLHEMFGQAGKMQDSWKILDEHEIVDGIDELGVLLYGHKKNAYWYGSQLSVEETRDLAPYQNATGLQVSSAALAGMVWALENPEAGIVEADEVDYKRCLEVQLPYLGPVKGYYTDWTPLQGRPGMFPEDIDESDPWQFKNILVR